jgi:asparagine synthase (glutamine-hydrolysing)
MCGFVALISPGGAIDQGLLQAMNDRLLHRGPDSGNVWMHANRRVGLAHRRLSIVDLSDASNQPMVAPGGDSCLAFNGEIYNFPELRSELKAAGAVFRTSGDTEVLLHALRFWGDAALGRLNGMFAFAFWDEKTRRLLVARDRFGEKPLFIGVGRYRTTVFASEMKAILVHPLLDDAVRESALTMYGGGRWSEATEATFFGAIEKLPPAHAAWYREDGVCERKWRYWTPDYTAVNEGIGVREAVEEFCHLLHSSVRARMRADVSMGSSLSGGLDSSSIVGIVAASLGAGSPRQTTFSAVFPEDATISEHREIDSIVRSGAMSAHFTQPTPEGLMQESQRLHWHQEEPFSSASIYLQWCVARLAREQGTTVLLDGQGADELLGGYQFYFKHYQLDLLDEREFNLAQRETLKFNRRLERAAVGLEQAERRFDRQVGLTPGALRRMKWLRPAPGTTVVRAGVPPPQSGQRLRRLLAEALQYDSLPMLLRYADRNSMAFGREARMPFLDYDLVDFCIRLPPRLLIRNGWQKWILRQSMANRVNDSIRWRGDKVGYAAPLDHWLRTGLKAWAEERLFSEELRQAPGFEHGMVKALWAEHQSGNVDRSWELWRWISLAEWLGLHRSGWWSRV